MDISVEVKEAVVWESRLSPNDLEEGRRSLRVYALHPDTLSMQIRTRCGIGDQGRSGVERNMIAMTSMTKAETLQLRDALNAGIKHKGWE